MVKLVRDAYSKCSKKNKGCLMNGILGSDIKTAQGSEGFDGNSIKLNIKLFVLNSEREIEEINY